jgi:hypothetical protein
MWLGNPKENQKHVYSLEMGPRKEEKNANHNKNIICRIIKFAG